jgi:hypothetical protein
LSAFPSVIQALNHGCLRISRELGYVGDQAVDIDAFDQTRYEEAVSW